MKIFRRARQAIVSVSVAFAVSLMMVAGIQLSPVAPVANATPEQTILKVIQNSEEPCRALSVNPHQHINALINRTWKKLGGTWEDAIDLTALSIIHYCRQYTHRAPMVAGVAFGPWSMIPFNSPEQPLMLAYHRGSNTCGIARSQGIHAAVVALSAPDPNRQAYGGVGMNEARMGMISVAVMFCKDQLVATRAYLGG